MLAVYIKQKIVMEDGSIMNLYNIIHIYHGNLLHNFFIYLICSFINEKNIFLTDI